MKKIRTVLSGLGNVNLGLLKILCEKHERIADEHGLEISIVGAADSSGIAVSDTGYAYDDLIGLKGDGEGVRRLDGFLPSASTDEIVNSVDADLLVEGSPAELESGNPGLDTIRNALKSGWSVVSANKAPLVLAFDELKDLEASYGGNLAYSAAVCGGLPIINVLKRDLKATELISLRGIFNATSNFVLEELERGRTLKGAVEEAQAVGAAETDPSLDIDGYDAAAKLFIIMKTFTDFGGNLSNISVEGIRTVTAGSIEQAAKRNKRIKLVAAAKRQNQDWALSVIPAEVDADSFLGRCDGWEMGIELQTDYYENLAMKIREKEPKSTSSAVLRDIVNLFSD